MLSNLVYIALVVGQVVYALVNVLVETDHPLQVLHSYATKIRYVQAH